MRLRPMAVRLCEDGVDLDKARPRPNASSWTQVASFSRRLLVWIEETHTCLAHRRHARALRKQLPGLSDRFLLDVGMEDYERARKSDEALIEFHRSGNGLACWSQDPTFRPIHKMLSRVASTLARGV